MRWSLVACTLVHTLNNYDARTSHERRRSLRTFKGTLRLTAGILY